jgi:hypothetical protein
MYLDVLKKRINTGAPKIVSSSYFISEPVEFNENCPYAATPGPGAYSAAILFDENKIYFTPEAVKSGNGNFHTCRETFAPHFTENTTHILMGCSPIKDGNHSGYRNAPAGTKISPEALGRFMSEVEKRLKLDEMTIIQRTTNNNCLLIHVPEWWRSCYMRRQMFTILLRAGLIFDGNFDKAIGYMYYLDNTRQAFNRFFAGYTKFHPSATAYYRPMNWGWAHIFNNNQNLEYLVKG